MTHGTTGILKVEVVNKIQVFGSHPYTNVNPTCHLTEKLTNAKAAHVGLKSLIIKNNDNDDKLCGLTSWRSSAQKKWRVFSKQAKTHSLHGLMTDEHGTFWWNLSDLP